MGGGPEIKAVREKKGEADRGRDRDEVDTEIYRREPHTRRNKQAKKRRPTKKLDR